MGYGKSKESASQEKKDLLGINPIANRASGGSFMSKHSSSQGMPRLGSPLHQEKDKYGRNIPGSNYFSAGSAGDKYLGPLLGGTANYSGGVRSRTQGGGSEITSKSFSGDSSESPGTTFVNYFKKNKPKEKENKNNKFGG